MQRKENLIARRAQLTEEISKLRKDMERLPKGTLVINTSKRKPQWFVQKKEKDGQFSRTYIKRESIVQAQKLARKAYTHAVLQDKVNEVSCIDHYLKVCREKDFRKYLQMNSPYRDLLVDVDWEREPYDKNQNYPDKLVVSTIKGDMVRSKSEALIANELLAYGVAYRYENKLVLEDIDIYPDFTIKSQRNRKLIIWEHFGRIDDPKYVAKTSRKIRMYLDNGYIPGVNLIMTFEDKMHPLTVETVRDMIERYLV